MLDNPFYRETIETAFSEIRIYRDNGNELQVAFGAMEGIRGVETYRDSYDIFLKLPVDIASLAGFLKQER